MSKPSSPEAARFAPAIGWLQKYRDWLLAGEPPVRYDLGPGFDSIELSPGSVLLVGAQPGAGKTALVVQWVVEALTRQPDLRAVMCNVEMHPSRLIARMVARLGKVSMDSLQQCDFSGRGVRAKMIAGLEAVEQIADRLAFISVDGSADLPPYSIENAKAVADAFGADLVVLDYVQRIGLASESSGPTRSDAAAMTQVMHEIRGMAARGVAVIVVSAVARQRDNNGRSSYSGVNLASFRGSSEIEFGCDDAYVLVRDDSLTSNAEITLQHVKARYREPQDIELEFDGSFMTFRAPQRRRS